ncbi:MAG: ketoacyl-ACP synthase III [Epulopiscium sp.]|nr:ketoacyl-ACP synthase III [Candidatus Epulonipiscium sp.]
MKDVRIIGTGRWIPKNQLTNDDLSSLVDTSDEWIRTRTGIQTRYVSTEENTSHLAAKAAQRAIQSAGLSPKDIDLIIVATMTPDGAMPSTACLVQKYLEAENAFCFDLSAACSGFVYALATATQFLQADFYNTALVIGAEALSKVIDWEDRNTCVLFGDGAGAVVLQKSKKKGIETFYLGADGKGDELLQCPGLPLQDPFAKEKQRIYPVEGILPALTMKGKEVFQFALTIVPACIQRILHQGRYDLTDIHHIVLHQANIRILEGVARKMQIPKEKFYSNINQYGNTSAASIPIALDEMREQNLLKEGEKVILVGFGGGLTWGAVLLTW